MDSLGKRLKIARKHALISQEQLGLDCNVSQGLISKIERGDQDETAANLNYMLAERCQVNPRWLSMGMGEMLGHEYSTTKNQKPVKDFFVNQTTAKDEIEILKIYRQLDSSAKKYLLGLLSGILGKQKESVDTEELKAQDL